MDVCIRHILGNMLLLQGVQYCVFFVTGPLTTVVFSGLLIREVGLSALPAIVILVPIILQGLGCSKAMAKIRWT